MKILIVILLTLSQAVFSDTFTQSPEFNLQGNKATITFSVSASTDVEVAILDSGGKVVRHLAAGVIGGIYDPPEPLQAGLSQSIDWDLMDDNGQPVSGGPLSMRVRLGLKPTFVRTLTTRKFDSGHGWYAYMYGPDGVDPQETYMPISHPNLSTNIWWQYHMDAGEPLHGKPPSLDVMVSDQTDEVFVKVHIKDRFSMTLDSLAKYDGITGQFLGYTLFRFNSATSNNVNYGEPVFSWDGQYVYWSEASDQGQISRMTNTGFPAPYAGKSTYMMSGFYASDIHTRGHAAGPDGSMYIAHYIGQGTANCSLICTWPSGANSGWNQAYGITRTKDGEIVDTIVVGLYAGLSGGVKVDPKGNIFVGAQVRPKDQLFPDFVDVNSLAGDINTHGTQKYWAMRLYGSLLKFPPSGGTLLLNTSGNYIGGTGQDDTLKATGLEWCYYGLSHVTSRRPCFCNTVRFDIDRYGRIFLPNTFNFEFVAIDNNRNEIFRIKNRDIPQVAIGLGHQIEVTDRGMYVADHFNNQIITFQWTADAETTLALPAGLALEDDCSMSNGLAFTVQPNPFNRMTRILIRSKEARSKEAKIQIYDVSGNLCFSTSLPLASLSYAWNAKHLPSGVYIIKAQMGKSVLKKRAVLLK